jgi:hypothetical protein
MTEYYKINSKDITYRAIDNEAVILNLKTGEYYSLNESATYILGLLESNMMGCEIISDKLAEEFSIHKKRAMFDTKRLLNYLKAEGIIIKIEKHPQKI